MADVKKAIEIAKQSLRSCYDSRGILTGSRQVHWSWDSFFASFGALEIGDHQIVKKNLELFLQHQNSEGNIPKRIANPFYALRFIKIPISESPSKQKPSFASPYYTGQSLSQCPTLVIAFYQYIKKTKDKAFLAAHFGQLQKIYKFLSKHSYRSGLLREPVGGGWAESILKRGAIAYTNMCYLESIRCMARMSAILGKTKKAQEFSALAHKVHQAIDGKLWEQSKGGFYSDWYGFSRHHHFNADGNLLALWWQIADREKSKKINIKIDELLSDSDPPIQQTSERYFFWRVFFTNQISGMKHYHTRFSWLSLGCFAALAKIEIGKKEEGIRIIKKIAQVINKYQTVHEILFNGKPVDLFFYQSEQPWAWAAGMFLYASKKAGYKVS